MPRLSTLLILLATIAPALAVSESSFPHERSLCNISFSPKFYAPRKNALLLDPFKETLFDIQFPVTLRNLWDFSEGPCSEQGRKDLLLGNCLV